MNQVSEYDRKLLDGIKRRSGLTKLAGNQIKLWRDSEWTWSEIADEIYERFGYDISDRGINLKYQKWVGNSAEN